MFKHHPKGLPVLFFTEMWERFGYYLMLGIFTLYMIDPVKNGGKGFSDVFAADIYGTFLALVYLTPFIGGLLADRVLGYRLAIGIGGTLMGLGYIGLSFQGDLMFYLSLGLIIFGNGFFKPNISTLVGNLYNTPEYKKYKESGFNIFYMGINIGAFVCNFVAAYLRNEYDWGYAFAAAGIGMFIGLIWFFFGQNHIKSADVIKPVKPEDMSLSKISYTIFVPLLAFGAAGWFIPQLLFGQALIGSHSNDAFLFACIPVIYFFFSLWHKASPDDKGPIAALLSVFGVVIIFWAIFHQNGSALTIWAERYTDRSMSPKVENVVSSMKLVQTVTTTPVETKKVDEHFNPVKDENGNEIVTLAPDPYFNNLPESEWPERDKPLKLISTEIFQSVNPFFVVIFTPVVIGFFGFLRSRKKEPSTPGKIGLGMLITALSTVVMIFAVIVSENGMVKSSAWWLISSYAVITIGELCLSPMGLALVSKLSPPRITSLMMGGWFLSTSIGNKLSGVISGLWVQLDNKVYFFAINLIGASIGALLIFVLLKWLKGIMDSHEKQSA